MLNLKNRKMIVASLSILLMLFSAAVAPAAASSTDATTVVNVYHVYDSLPEDWEYQGFKELPSDLIQGGDPDYYYYSEDDDDINYLDFWTSDAYLMNKSTGSYQYTDGTTGNTFSYDGTSGEYAVSVDGLTYRYNDNGNEYVVKEGKSFRYDQVTNVENYINTLDGEFNLKSALIQYNTTDVTLQRQLYQNTPEYYKTVYAVAGRSFDPTDTDQLEDHPDDLRAWKGAYLSNTNPSGIRTIKDSYIITYMYQYAANVFYPVANQKPTYFYAGDSFRYLDAGNNLIVTAFKNGNYDFVFEENTYYDMVIQYTKDSVGNGFVVKFEPNGGTPKPADQTLTAGDKVIEPSGSGKPVKSGSSLTGWYTDSALKNKWNFTADTVSSDMTLYAGWKSSGGNGGNNNTTNNTTPADPNKPTSGNPGNSVPPGLEQDPENETVSPGFSAWAFPFLLLLIAVIIAAFLYARYKRRQSEE